MSAMHKPAAKSEINVTPLIDIVLVLLIVFIVMVPGMMKASSVVVPQSAPVDKDRKNQPAAVVLTLDAEGKLFLQQEEIQLGQIVERLAPVVCLQPLNNRKVFLKVDGDLPHQKAVDVLDRIRLASDKAKFDTKQDPTKGCDGGDVKVIVALKKA